MRVLAALLLSAASVACQEAQLRGSVGWAGGSFRFDSDAPGLDDRADAELFHAHFEATSSRGFGGGLRYERFASDGAAGLFRDPLDPLDPGVKASNEAFQAHFTYRVQQHRFEMAVRAGLMQSKLVLDDPIAADPETDFTSFGPFFEIEPEVTLVRRGPSRWSVYGKFGFAYTPTSIDVDNDPRDYSSESMFLNLELGTRYSLGPVELGLAFLGRYQSMDQSAAVGGQFVYGFDSGFHGLLLSAGVRF